MSPSPPSVPTFGRRRTPGRRTDASKEPAMTVTTTRLGQAAGLAAAAAGAIFIAVQINHPAMEVASVDHDRVGRAQHRQGGHGGAGPRRHHRHVPAPAPAGRPPRPRRLPAVRPATSSCSAVEFVAAFVLPDRGRHGTRLRRTTSSPRPPAARRPGTSALMQAVFSGQGAGYLARRAALRHRPFRAGVLARWAAALLAVGTGRTARAGGAARLLQPAARRARRASP